MNMKTSTPTTTYTPQILHANHHKIACYLDIAEDKVETFKSVTGNEECNYIAFSWYYNTKVGMYTCCIYGKFTDNHTKLSFTLDEPIFHTIYQDEVIIATRIFSLLWSNQSARDNYQPNEYQQRVLPSPKSTHTNEEINQMVTNIGKNDTAFAELVELKVKLRERIGGNLTSNFLTNTTMYQQYKCLVYALEVKEAIALSNLSEHLKVLEHQATTMSCKDYINFLMEQSEGIIKKVFPKK